MPILNLEKCISYIARFILIFRRSILVLSYIIIHMHDKWSLPSKMGESYKDPPIVRVVRLERIPSSTQRLSLCSFGTFVPRIALSAPFTLLFCALISTDSRCSEAVCGLIWGQKRFLTRGRQVSAGPGREAFFRERSYSLSSSCWAASMAARLSRIRGSSYDFLRHIQQEQ